MPVEHGSFSTQDVARCHRERHYDFIDVNDFPECWNELVLTVEVEAKAKEPAVLKLKTDLEQRHAPKKFRNRS